MEQNSYGSLCTEMYELLHPEAPPEELAFYLSYAKKGERILEPLCGSGRFLVPFLERGLTVSGMDASAGMLEKLRKKAPAAQVRQAALETYETAERFDYIFITSGSMSLFTDISACRQILLRLRELLRPDGVLVFAVDTVAARCLDDAEYRAAVSVEAGAGRRLVLKTKNRYDPETQTQFSPGIYELYHQEKLLQTEEMDFRTHLYRFGEMEGYLDGAGFTRVRTYAAFDKTPAQDDRTEQLLYECRL